MRLLPYAALLAGTWSPALPIRAPSCIVSVDLTASRFEFASSPWVNLYNFLVKQGKRVRGIDDDGLGARGYVAEDTAALRALSYAEADQWAAAVDFFAHVEIPNALGIDSLVQKINIPLAAAAPEGNLDDVVLHSELRRVLRDAMPIYRAVWWPRHDGRNRQWIASMRGQLAGREPCLVRRAEEIFRASWPAAPIRVDATVFASWFGAYSTHHPTRITVSANARGSQDSFGLEVLLHESAHAMLGPLDSTLAEEAARQGKQLPAELSHLVLFFTAGELTTEAIPSHVSFAEAFGIWRRTPTTRHYRDLIQREWQPYLAGSRSFGDAVAALVRGL